jgi:hypothetical protein
MRAMSGEGFDVVYMWVDDRWPGYTDELRRHAQSTHDRNPNRTRDNLETLKFSLRSIELYAPWRRNVYVVTCRPQCPAWLKRSHPALRVVHHDEIMPADILPSFNSFAIQSYLHEIPGLSRRFVCFDDDMLLMGPTSIGDFVAHDGRIRYDFHGRLPRRTPSRSASPWNAALANNAALLDEIDPRGRHPGFAHGPKMYDTGDCAELIERWSAAFQRTRRSRFRAHDNVAMEALLPQYLVARGRAIAVDTAATRRRAAYLGLENIEPWNRFWLWRIERSGIKFLTLNDNFGPDPNQLAVRNARRKFEALFAAGSAYEIRAPAEPAALTIRP